MGMSTLGSGMKVVAGLAALAGTLVSAAPPMRAQEAAAKKKVLMVWGGWEGHQPKQTVDVFAPWLTAQGFDVEIVDTLDVYLDAQKLRGLSLIVQAVTMGQVTSQQERGLLDAVRGGVGLAGWHGGLADFVPRQPGVRVHGGRIVGSAPGQHHRVRRGRRRAARPDHERAVQIPHQIGAVLHAGRPRR